MAQKTSKKVQDLLVQITREFFSMEGQGQIRYVWWHKSQLTKLNMCLSTNHNTKFFPMEGQGKILGMGKHKSQYTWASSSFLQLKGDLPRRWDRPRRVLEATPSVLGDCDAMFLLFLFLVPESAP